MDAKALPKTLYKYRSWDDKNHRRMLWHNEIYFASPKDFNDPFDSNIPLLFEKMTPSQQVEYVVPHFSLQNPALSPQEVRNQVEQMVEEGLLTRPDVVKELRKKQQEQRDKWGIFTASSDRANILMWSHYASEHQGFCVGLDYSRVHDKLRRIPDLYLGTVEVIYSRLFPLLIPNRLNDTEYFRRQFALKFGDWSYEREWRLLMYDVNETLERKIIIDPEIITEVILGCQMPPSDVEEIMRVLSMRDPRPKLFRAVKKELEFGLVIEPIEDY